MYQLYLWIGLIILITVAVIEIWKPEIINECFFIILFKYFSTTDDDNKFGYISIGKDKNLPLSEIKKYRPTIEEEIKQNS